MAATTKHREIYLKTKLGSDRAQITIGCDISTIVKNQETTVAETTGAKSPFPTRPGDILCIRLCKQVCSTSTAVHRQSGMEDINLVVIYVHPFHWYWYGYELHLRLYNRPSVLKPVMSPRLTASTP